MEKVEWTAMNGQQIGEIAEYYKAEVERLQSLLQAEQRHNHQLMAAIGHLQAATALGQAVAIMQENTGDALDGDGLKAISTVILNHTTRAGALLLPVAKD